MLPGFGIRFDLRNPAWAGVDTTEQYAAALDMVEWADRLGFGTLTISEHHGVDDGYLPSAVTFAAAAAARSQRIRIRLGAVVAPLHDPVRLAEQVAVLDRISRGRIDLVLAVGYVDAEYEAAGVARRDRVLLLEEAVAVLRQAWTGEPFEFRGRTVRVTPTPHQRPGPPVILGGTVEAAARRAARIGDGFMPSLPSSWEWYRDELVRLGRPDPGPMPDIGPLFNHCAEDVEEGWRAVGRHVLHEMNAYGRWAAEGGSDTPFVEVDDLGAARSSGVYSVETPEQMVARLRSMVFPILVLHPLMGGIPPAVAWESLRLIEEKVAPAFRM